MKYQIGYGWILAKQSENKQQNYADTFAAVADRRLTIATCNQSSKTLKVTQWIKYREISQYWWP